jgi:hypothetical protein
MKLAEMYNTLFILGIKLAKGQITHEFMHEYLDLLEVGKRLNHVSVISQYFEPDVVQTLTIHFVDQSVLVIAATGTKFSVVGGSFDDGKQAIRFAVRTIAEAGGDSESYMDRLEADTLDAIVDTENPQ